MDDYIDTREMIYSAIHSQCFFPAQLGPSAVSYEERMQRHIQAGSRSTESVKAGADRGDVGDVLEYGIRLVSGMHATRDVRRAFRLFVSTGEGPFPREIRAIAYSIASLAAKMLFAKLVFVPMKDPVSDEASYWLGVSGDYANKAAGLGLFSWGSLIFAQFWDGGIPLRRVRSPAWGGWKDFWVAYAKFREETGTQRQRANRCAKCNTRKSQLKCCGGACSFERRTKPLYCSRECQVSDWKYHKQFCNATAGLDMDKLG